MEEKNKIENFTVEEQLKHQLKIIQLVKQDLQTAFKLHEQMFIR